MTRKLNGRVIAADVLRGASDVELMEKFDLSPSQLAKTTAQLKAAGLIAYGVKCPSCGYTQPEEFVECPQCRVILSKVRKNMNTQQPSINSTVSGVKSEASAPSRDAPPQPAGAPTSLMSPSQLYAIGKAQRLLLLSFLAGIVATVGLATLSPLLILLWILVNLFAFYCVWTLGKALGFSVEKRMFYLVLMFIPVVSILALLSINFQATETLRNCGIRVGLMGAKRADLPDVTDVGP